MTVLAWNSGLVSSNITIGNMAFETAGNTLATLPKSITSGWNVVAGNLGYTSGKYYFELVFGGNGDYNSSVMGGLCNASVNTTTYLGNDSNGFGLQAGGQAAYGCGGSPGWGSNSNYSPSNGTRVGFAVDIGNKKFWVRLASSGWLSGDPVAGTGGGTWSFSGTIYPAACIGGTTVGSTQQAISAWVGISGSSHNFANPPPTGFSAWGDTSSYASPTQALDTSWCASGDSFSSGNLEVTFPNMTDGNYTWSMVPSNKIIQANSQFYYEVTANNGDGLQVGVAAPLTNPVDWLGAALQYGPEISACFGIGGDSWAFTYSSTPPNTGNGIQTTGVSPGWSSGANLGIAIDTGLMKMWLRINGGSWYGGSSPNPSTGSGGIDITAVCAQFGGAVLPAIAGAANASATVNFGGSAFVYTSPFGLFFTPALLAGYHGIANAAYESQTSTICLNDNYNNWNSSGANVSYSTGKYYVEFAIGGPPVNVMVGLCNASLATYSYLGGTSASFGLQGGGSGTSYNTGGTSGWSTGSGATASSGVRVGLAADVGNQKFWVRINGGSWLNGDPVAETGGGTWSFSGPVYPAVGISGSGNNPEFINAWVIISGSPHNFSAPAPSGYTNWGDVTSSYATGTQALDPTWAANSVTFSSGNLEASFSAENVWRTVQSNIIDVSGSRYYFEVKLVSSSIMMVGLAPPATDPQDYLGSSSELSIGIQNSGDIYFNGTHTTGGPTWGTGDIVCVAVDLNLKKLWIRVNGGVWYGGTSPNPTYGTGGIDISALTAPYGGAILPAGAGNNSSVLLFNFGATSFAYSNPFGPNAAIIPFRPPIFDRLLRSLPEKFSRRATPKTRRPPSLILRASGSLYVDMLVRKVLISGGSTVLVNVDLAVRKILALINPSSPLNSFGAIPVFPSLPVGFPVKVSPVMDTTIGTTKSLREVRNALQTYPIWDIEILFEELRDQTQNQSAYGPFIGYTQYMQLVQLWLSMYGQTNVFAFDCPWDDSRSNQTFGTGDGSTTAFTVYRTWGSGAQATEAPVGALNVIYAVYANGTQVNASLYQAERNQIVFATPPASGATLSATFSFYYLCRWTEDEQDYEEFAKNRWLVQSLKFRASPW